MKKAKRILGGIFATILGGVGVHQLTTDQNNNNSNQVLTQVKENINKGVISKSKLELRKEKENKYWFGDQRDQILNTILIKFQSISEKRDFFQSLLKEEKNILLSFRKEYWTYIRNTSNSFNEKNVTQFQKNINWIAKQYEISEKNKFIFDEKNFHNHSYLNQKLKQFKPIFEKEIRYLRFGDSKIKKYLNEKDYYLFKDASIFLSQKKELTQEDRNNLFILNKVILLFKINKRYELIYTYLQNPIISEGEDIIENVDPKNKSLVTFENNLRKIHFSKINPRYYEKNKIFAKRYGFPVIIANLFMLKENNFGLSKSSKKGALGPMQVLPEEVKKFILKKEQKKEGHFSDAKLLEESYEAGFYYISTLIKKYNLQFDENITFPVISKNQNINDLNYKDKRIIFDFLILSSFYFSGESEDSYLESNQFRKNSHRYIQKSFSSFLYIYD